MAFIADTFYLSNKSIPHDDLVRLTDLLFPGLFSIWRDANKDTNKPIVEMNMAPDYIANTVAVSATVNGITDWAVVVHRDNYFDGSYKQQFKTLVTNLLYKLGAPV